MVRVQVGEGEAWDKKGTAAGGERGGIRLHTSEGRMSVASA